MNSHTVSPLRFAQGQALSPCASLRVNSAKGLSRAAARSFAALRMTVGTDRKPGCLLTTAARSFAALRMTGLDLAVAEELSRSFEPCLSNQRCTSWLAGDDVRMMAQRSMFCTCKKSKIGEVLPLLLCYTVPCAEDQLKAKAPWHENVIQAKVFVAYHNDETAKKLADTIRAAGVTNVKKEVCNA